MMERIFVLCAFIELNTSFCDEKEAAEAINEIVEDERLDADDFVVVRGKEIKLTIKKRKASTISFDGVKLL